jgi:uncharacterized protein YjbI with pentapeptide repeats
MTRSLRLLPCALVALSSLALADVPTDAQLAPCLTEGKVNVCVGLSMDAYIAASDVRRAVFERGNTKYLDLLDTWYAVLMRTAAKGCELGADRACNALGRGLTMPMEFNAAQLAIQAEVLPGVCEKTKKWCKEAAAAKSGPAVAEVRNGDVEATLALLKKQGHLNAADLSGKKLQGINLDGASLKGANLSNAVLTDASLDGTNLDGAKLDGAVMVNAFLNRATLVGGSAVKTNFEKARGAFASLKSATLKGASLSAVADGALLEGTNLEGAYATKCAWSGDLRTTKLDGATLDDCVFDGVNLAGVTLSRTSLERTTFKGSNLQRVTFVKAALRSASFSSTDLSGTSFKGVDAENTLFDDARLKEADFTGAKLKDAKFAGSTSVAGVKFDNATLCGTGLEKVKGWSSASTSGAKLTCD